MEYEDVFLIQVWQMVMTYICELMKIRQRTQQLEIKV